MIERHCLYKRGRSNNGLLTSQSLPRRYFAANKVGAIVPDNLHEANHHHDEQTIQNVVLPHNIQSSCTSKHFKCEK